MSVFLIAYEFLVTGPFKWLLRATKVLRSTAKSRSVGGGSS
ncbi:MAG: hypothetical protein ACE5H4_07065 [Candidatus Thorarchaeota archaeon]